MDTDLDRMSREELVAEVRKLRQGIRRHRDSTGHELCWHHPALWALLPERSDPVPTVPAWPEFLRGCVRYRESLDEQLPHAPRAAIDPPAPDAKRVVFHALACNNAWANLRLLRACSQLTDEELAARRTSFFPSLKATLNHIVTVDWYYVDALERAAEGKPPNPAAERFFEPEEPFDTGEAIAAAQRAVDQRLVALCRSLSDRGLSATVGL